MACVWLCLRVETGQLRREESLLSCVRVLVMVMIFPLMGCRQPGLGVAVTAGGRKNQASARLGCAIVRCEGFWHGEIDVIR